jgi:hypothetical protein
MYAILYPTSVNLTMRVKLRCGERFLGLLSLSDVGSKNGEDLLHAVASDKLYPRTQTQIYGLPVLRQLGSLNFRARHCSNNSVGATRTRWLA